MARAGFTAIHTGRIRFTRDGRWLCDGEPITNAAICRLYARAMTVGDDGVARLELGPDRAEVDVEDTPWVVTGVERTPAGTFRIVLNDGTQEPLRPETLRIGPEHVLYCRAHGGRHEVRFLRAAYYELMRHADVAPDGSYVLLVGDEPVRLPTS